MQATTQSEGVPIGLATAPGGTIIATDLLSSVTVMRAQPLGPGQLPSLLPLSADLSGRDASTAAALPLGPDASDVLVGASGGGLLLLRRNAEAEARRWIEAVQEWGRLRERGESAAGGGAIAMPAALAALAGGMQDVEAAATAPTDSTVVALCPGRLGVPQWGPGEQLDSEGMSYSRGPSADAATSPATGVLVVATVGGAVISCWLLEPEQHRVLAQLQQAAEEVTAGCSSGVGGLRLPSPSQDGGDDGEDGLPHGAAAAGALRGGIDGDLLVAAFLEPDRYQALLRSAPDEAVQQGRAILQACGLLLPS